MDDKDAPVRKPAPKPESEEERLPELVETEELQAASLEIDETAKEIEEEVEIQAAMGFLGGPAVWGLLALLALLFIYVVFL
jgi:hypothetical protein